MTASRMKDPEKDKPILEESSSVSYSKVLLLFFLIMVITLSTIAVFISYKTRYGTYNGMETSLRERYPGYFRFYDEQAVFSNLPLMINSVSPLLNYSSTNQQGSSVFTKYLLTDFHACCQSTGRYVSPVYWVDYQGINRTMAVFKDPVTGLSAKQYFYTETCLHKRSCRYKCRCSQKIQLVTGIYVAGTQYGLSWFPLLGSCKCRNTATLFMKTLFQAGYRQ